MNLAELRARVSGVTGLSNIDSEAEQSLIDGWLNEGILLWLVETKMFKQRFAISVTAGTADYTLDPSLLSFTDAFYTPSDGSQEYMLEPKDSAEIRQLRLYQTAAPTAPMFYAIEGTNMFMLYPTPASSTDKIHVIGVASAISALAASADTPSNSAYGGIPAEWHPAIEAYAKWRAADYSDNPKTGQWMQEWDMWKVKARVRMNTKAGTRLPRALWGRRRRYPATPGTDIGA